MLCEELSIRMENADNRKGKTANEKYSDFRSFIINNYPEALKFRDEVVYLEDFAEIAGMTADSFAKLWNSNAAGAVTAFIGNLNNVEQHGRSAVQILDEMGMTEIRLSNTLLALANSGDLMTRAISLSNEAWEENVALSEEVEKRYATTESIMNITKNNLTDIGITV